MPLYADHERIELYLRKLGSYESSPALIHGLMKLAAQDRLSKVNNKYATTYLTQKGLGENLERQDQQNTFADLVVLLAKVVNRTRQEAQYLDD